ncbi:mCG23562, isoform CRA_a [Mus musculus]|nr:mCG23562, isoform CRA_a [Mus musculus]
MVMPWSSPLCTMPSKSAFFSHPGLRPRALGMDTGSY